MLGPRLAGGARSSASWRRPAPCANRAPPRPFMTLREPKRVLSWNAKNPRVSWAFLRRCIRDSDAPANRVIPPPMYVGMYVVPARSVSPRAASERRRRFRSTAARLARARSSSEKPARRSRSASVCFALQTGSVRRRSR